jgi:hypothetical protein
MLSATFIGEVQHGQLHIGQPLAAFEGKQVLITLIAPDIPLASSGSFGAPSQWPPAPPDAEIIEDAGRIRMPSCASETVTAQILAIGRQAPRLSSEEE